MKRSFKLGTATMVAILALASLAFAAIQTGKFAGTSDDEEPVTIVVGKNDEDKKVVKSFKVDQGEECGVTKVSKKADPDIMPVRIKDGEFKIVQRHEALDVVTFKVKGAFHTESGDLITGNYSQAACDGAKDTFVAYLETE